MSKSNSFGNSKSIAGAAGAFESTLVPKEYVGNLKKAYALPITVTTTVFTVNCSVTRPGYFWDGNDYFNLKSTKAYTWGTSNTILHATTGAVTTGQVGAAGVWYFYLGLVDGVITLYPSKGVPNFVQGPKEGVVLGHPGTARTAFWTYVGWHTIATAGDSATDPACLAATKVGFTYNFAEQAKTITGISSGGTLITTDYSAILPAHRVVVGGYLVGTDKSGTTVEIGGSGTLGQGIQRVSTRKGSAPPSVPLGRIDLDTAAALYHMNSGTGDAEINITFVEDVV